MSTLRASFLVLAATVIGGAPLAAHHGRGATFDMKKQLTLKMRMWSGATGQLTVPFPKGAPSVADLLLKEANVKLQLTAIDPTTQISKNLQTIATRDGSNQILVTSIEYNP